MFSSYSWVYEFYVSVIAKFDDSFIFLFCFFFFLFLLLEITLVVSCYATNVCVLGLIPNFLISLISVIDFFYVNVMFSSYSRIHIWWVQMNVWLQFIMTYYCTLTSFFMVPIIVDLHLLDPSSPIRSGFMVHFQKSWLIVLREDEYPEVFG